jgi:hypothetical protein
MKLHLVLCAVLAVGLAACNKVDNEDMAKKIKDTLSKQLDGKSDVKIQSVDCPSGQELKEGNKFDCQLHFEGGLSMAAHIEIQKDKMFSWSVDPDDQAKLMGGGGAEAGSGEEAPK